MRTNAAHVVHVLKEAIKEIERAEMGLEPEPESLFIVRYRPNRRDADDIITASKIVHEHYTGMVRGVVYQLNRFMTQVLTEPADGEDETMQ